MAKKLTVLFFMILSFSACQKKTLKKEAFDVELEKEAQVLQESVARISDIPDVPLPVVIKKIIYAPQDSDQLQIFCDMTGVDKIELCSYYEAGMERLGWDFQGFCSAQEELLVFAKPSGSLCVLSLRDNQRMVITIMKKKDLL